MTITLYQAGAGSGKTYTITQEIVTRIASGTVDPMRIMATTFTRKAAAELKDRIQERLLHPEPGDPELAIAQRLRLAEGLDQALIGTVHSVGHQILSRYALRLGISPMLEPIEEKAQERHLRLIMAEMPRAGLRELDAVARRLGVDEPQELVLQILDQKRGNAIGDDAFRSSMIAGTQQLIEIISGDNSVALASFEQFYEACRDALQRIEGNGDETKTTQNARETLSEIIRAGDQSWAMWGKVAKLPWAKKTEAAVAELTTLARRANVHANLHADLKEFTIQLVDRCLELQTRYQHYKSTHGLVDFMDLEERFLQLLADDVVASDLGASLDLVVVDEFQDTNPIQLAIFQRLATLAKASLWVGDEKQAIYGFRGTDSKLMQDVLSTVPNEDRKTLPKNWRSQPGLVEIVNQIFGPIFGKGARLQPAREGKSRAQRWMLEGKNKDVRRAAFIAQMQDLVQGESPGDIAILVRKNEDAVSLATELRAAGIPTLVQTSGLLSTREGAMLLAGLRLVADRRDRLAAATLQTIESDDKTPAWFAAAMREPDTVLQHPLVYSITSIDARSIPPSGVIMEVLQALALPDRIAEWGDPHRRSANLDALVELGQRYEDESEQEGKAATLTGLVYWLENLKKKGDDLLPSAAGVDAVRIMTMHASKGLEWPIVIMFQDGAPPDPHPFKIHVTGGNAAGGRPLEGRALSYWPYPFGRTFYGGLGSDGSGVQDAAKQSPEGISLQDAQNAETQRLLYVGFTRAREQLIIAEAKHSALGLLPGIDSVLDPEQEIGVSVHGAEYQAIRCDRVPEPSESPRRAMTWFEAGRGAVNHADRYWSPSSAEPVPCEVTTEPLPGDHPFPRIKTDDWTALGEAVHAFLGARPTIRHLALADQERHAAAALRRWNRGGDLEPGALVQAAKRLEQWAGPGASWHAEVPVTGPRVEAGQWVGIADLLLDGETGLKIVDHKSSDWGESGWHAKAASYSGQLAVYSTLLAAKHATIHFALAGGLAEVNHD